MDQKNNFISERKESQKLIQNEPPQTKLQNFDLIINSTTPLLNEDLSVDPTLTPQEKRGVFLLHSLYFIQGIPLGLFGFSASVIILLTEAGADFSDLGVLSFCMYPFAFKMLFAPIEDTYFSPRFGKRKSYIIPLQYILAALFFISSFIIEDLILSKSIGTIFLVGFVMVWIASLQDIAVDGWNLTILQNHNLGWGSVAQSVGQQVGVVLGSTVLIIFSSTKFCNDYLYSEPSTTPLISINSFFKIFVIIIIVINVYVHFFVKERNPVSNDEFPTVWALVKHLKGFYYNKNLKFYMFMMMTWKLGFFTVSATFPLKLIQQGFPKETIASVMTCLIPVNFVASFLTGKYVKIGTEFTYYFKIYALHLVNDVISFILVNNYNNISSGVFLLFFIIVCFIHYSVITAMFVIQGQFNNRISDEDVGGSYLTFLNSINNLGKMGANSLVFFLVGAFNYGVIVFCSWIFTICYLINFGKQIRDLEKIEKKDWKLS